MAVIVMAGQIASGKSTLTKMLSDRLGSKPFYEPVKNNPVLPLFYKDPDKYAFLLQIYFLNTRFASIKKALSDKNNVLDRSIYEDSLFFHTNADLGRANPTEVKIYDSLLNNMMEELKGMPKKSPDLLEYIHTDYETKINHIEKRGRTYEQPESDSTLPNYYKTLLKAYDPWYNNYNSSPKMMIDGTTTDFVNNLDDRESVLNRIQSKLDELRG